MEFVRNHTKDKTIWILNHHANDTYFDKGGRHYSIAKYLKKNGYKPVIFCSNAEHGTNRLYYEELTLYEEHIEENIDVPYVFVRGRTYYGNGTKRILCMCDYYHNVKKAAVKYAKKYGEPDVIIGSQVHPLAVLAAEKLAKKYKAKFIAEIRDLWPESITAYGIVNKHNPAIFLLRRLEKHFYKKADTVIFLMEGAYDYIIEQGWEKDIPRSKVVYINNGVDIDMFNYNRDHFIINDKDLDNSDIFKVIYTGSIRKVNNLGKLLDVAKLVKNENVLFLIWGDGNEREYLEKRLLAENISNVVLKGKVEKNYIPSIVSKADLNIIHSTSSPLLRFGISFNKLFEYLAAGKPALVDFKSKYNPTLEGNAGVEVDSGDAKDIAEAIDVFAKLDRDKYMNYCDNATKTAKEYDFSVLTKKLEELIT